MHRKILLLLLLLVLLPVNKTFAAFTSIHELNDSKYTIGVSDKGAALDAVKRDLPLAKIAYYDGVDGFMAVKTRKIDAYINDRITMILALKNGFEGVKILPGSVGEPIKIAVGISRKSKIPDLRKKINEFIAILNSDGTLNDMKERWVFDSNYTMPEINTPSSPKFKLVVGTVGMIPPYSFYEGSKLTGHDIEFVKRFAAWLGADVVFKDYDFAGVIAAAVTGDVDIIAANLQISPERAEKIDFSDIIMSSDFSVMVRDDSPKKVDSHNSIKYLNGKNIGIQTGNPEWDKIIKQILPASNILYYNTFTDLLAALKAHKIDSFPGDEANLKFIAEEDKSVMILDEDITETYGLSFAFTKADLRNKFNDFMKEIKADGRLNSIVTKWTTESGNKIAVDYESLPGTNGTLTFATEGEYPPFNYVLNGKIAGMEIDLAYEFCKLYGYGLNVLTMNYEAIPAAITSNKADFSANLTIDDEHKEALIFSVPYYFCATKLMVLKNDPPAKPANNSGYSSLQDLNGKRIGVITGSIHPEIVLPVLPDAELFYFNTKADEVAALVSGKIDAFLCSEPEAISLMSENNNLSYMNTRLSQFDLAYCTAKNSKGAALAEELSKFIRELENNGTLSKLRDKWFRSSDESQKPLEDYSQLPAKNGVIRFAQFAHGVPFTYLRDNIIVGYEVEILVKFCKEKGYGLEVITMDFGGILPAVLSGKCDVAGGGIIITPERAQQVNFTEPIYHSGTVLMTLKSNLADDNKLAQKISDFNGKRIGVITGSITPEIVKSTLPDAERFYFDSPSDEIAALLANKIDAFVYSRIEANTMIAASENDNLSYLNEPLSSFELAFCTAKTPKGKSLADELNEFLRRIDNDGTLKILRDKWLTDSKSQKTLDEDYSQLPAKNGVIKFAQTGIFPPFSYVSNGKTVGYDIEIIAKFCKEKGYGLEIFTMNFAGILAGIDSGRFDMGGGGLIITPERSEQVNFTVPNYKGDFVIVAMKSDSAGDNKSVSKLDDLNGKRIGALTGSIFPELIKSRLPLANIFYFSSRADEAAALTAGKIDAFALSEPEAMSAESENSKLTYIHDYINKFDFAYCLAKNNKLTPELSKFISDLESNGTLSKWRDKWFRGTDESQKTLEDYSQLPAVNGVIKFAQDGASAPFSYVRDNRVVGYEIEILANFCKEKGYSLEILTMDLSAMIPALQSGKCDIAGGGVAVTAERAEKVDFTTPDFNSGSVLVVLKSPAESLLSVKDFDGKKIALSSSSIYDKAVKEILTHSEILYMDNYANQLKSLLDGKVDAIVRDEPEAMMLKDLYPQLVSTQDYLMKYDNAFIAAKNAHGDSLLAELNEFIKQSENNGTLQNLRDVWFHSDESKKVMTDYENLPDTNGVIKFAVNIEIPPFSYVRDNKIVGYEIEIIARFCKEKGYKLEIEVIDFSGLLASVASGKNDLGGSAISITEERAQSVNFSEPVYRGGCVLISKKDLNISPAAATTQETKNYFAEFISDLEASFERTFLREDRWHLFLEGTITTLIITVLAILFGTVLGFAVYMMCRRGNIIANLFTKFFVWLIHGMPMVVLLMILYYVIFSSVAISGLWVAVIAFTLTFGSSVYAMILSGVGAVDKGQTEAALALGFSDIRTFFTVILPQAALHFMPSYKAAVVELIKATAIVGYIAVQDLTKMGDIVRSRTYEAFFPLIAVAVIYFILAGILNLFFGRIHNSLKPERRKPSDILRGIDTKEK